MLRDGGAEVTRVLLLSGKQELDKLRSIDEGEGAAISAPILVENTAKGLPANFYLRNKPVVDRSLRHAKPP